MVFYIQYFDISVKYFNSNIKTRIPQGELEDLGELISLNYEKMSVFFNTSLLKYSEMKFHFK